MEVEEQIVRSDDCDSVQSLFGGIFRWGLEDWMFTSVSFSLCIGLFMLMFSPAEGQEVNQCLVFSTAASFLITVCGADWVQSLKIPGIRETSERLLLRCTGMIFGPIMDLVIFGSGFFACAVFFSFIAQISGVLVILTLPLTFFVGTMCHCVRNDLMKACRRPTG